MVHLEIKKRSNTFFRAFDLDGDGLITQSELHSVLKKLGEDFSDDEVKELISEADLDGDGKVSFPEFEKMIVERDSTSK